MAYPEDFLTRRVSQPKRKTPEGQAKKAIRDYLAWIGARMVLQVGGIGTGDGRADLIGHYKGMALAIEVKAPKGKASALQRAWEQWWVSSGGIYILAKSVEDVAGALGAPFQGELL